MQENGAPRQPEHIGILALEVYVPPTYVSQEELEAHDGVAAGRYTAGLGQEALSFCEDCEDVVSLAMSAVQALMLKHGIDPTRVGRLEVGTESSLDRSKPVRSYLMPLFPGNSSIEGVDCVGACLGATTAFLNAVNWMESRTWDGRLAIVVASDIAVYPEGPARASGGAGAAAMLIGPDAPLVLDRKVMATHSEHAHDFYKPAGQFFPVWDGRESVDSYLRTLRGCYGTLCDRFEASAAAAGRSGKAARFSIDRVDYAVFHAPFNRMTRKAMATIADADTRRRAARRSSLDSSRPSADATGQAAKISLDGTESLYHSKVASAAELPRQTGNMYTASLWAGLASLISELGDELLACQILMFSYGSGAAGSMFMLRGRRSGNLRFNLDLLSRKLGLEARLAARVRRSPKEFHAAAEAAECLWGRADWEPQSRCFHDVSRGKGEHMRPGSYRLVQVDAQSRRTYEQVTP